MIFLLIILLFALKFNNQSVYLDYLLSLLICLAIASLIIIYYISKKLIINIKHEDKKYYEGDSIDISFVIEEPVFHTTIKPVITIDYLQYEDEKIDYRTIIDEGVKTYTINNLQPGTIALSVDRVYIYGLFKTLALPVKYKYIHKFNVYPTDQEIDNQFLGKVIVHGQGEVKNVKGDDYTELYEIRPMQEGDDLRYIHKTLSAKHDEYIMKVGSDSQITYYIYNLQNRDDFSKIKNKLGQIIKLSKDVLKEENFAFSISYNGKLTPINQDLDLYKFIDKVYKEYER